MKNILKRDIYNRMESYKKYVPPFIRGFIRSHWNMVSYDGYRRQLYNPHSKEPNDFNVPGSPCRLGIIKELFQYHKSYITACRELGISYRLIDISGSDWIDRIQDAECDAFLLWPSSVPTPLKDMFDDRIRILVEDLGKTIYPSLKETWLYESKRRQHYWLTANGIPHPKTWVFYSLADAQDFMKKHSLPITLKTNSGGAASGVYILRNRKQANKTIRAAFKDGIRIRRNDPLDRQRGAVYLQEYFKDFREWRMVRIGESYFGHLKERVGDFHSGSGKVGWEAPSKKMLAFLRMVTEKGAFTSMDVDVFETPNGMLVNELQTVFGASVAVDQMKIDGTVGRYTYQKENGAWVFEAGDFARNACANLRVEYLVASLLSGKREK
jgi:glutathione synthase/RimK-type ligase-like ATP-grasp enzyme